MNPVLSSPLKTTLSITNVCNLHCRYCYSDCSQQPAPDEMTTGEWLRLIDELIEAGVVQLFIEGGEPLCRPDLFSLLRHCRGRAMTWVRTHGTLVTPAVSAALKDGGVSTVLVDVHGAEPATHDHIVGVPGSHRLALQGVQNLVAAGVRVFMLLVLNRHNHRELQAYVELAKELGAARVGILRLYPLGRARKRWSELALSLEEMSAALNIAVPDGLGLMQSWHPRNGNCCYQLSAVTASGNSIGCPYLRDFVNYGSVRDVPFMQTWNHPLWQRLRAGNVEGGCSSCGASEGSIGGCRSTAYAFTGNWDAPDPFCKVTNHGIDLRELPDRQEAAPTPQGGPRVAGRHGVRP